jgi:hypothetical protein
VLALTFLYRLLLLPLFFLLLSLIHGLIFLCLILLLLLLFSNRVFPFKQ